MNVYILLGIYKFVTYFYQNISAGQTRVYLPAGLFTSTLYRTDHNTFYKESLEHRVNEQDRKYNDNGYGHTD